MFGERIREWATVGGDLIWAPRPSGQGKQLRHAWYQNAWLTNELIIIALTATYYLGCVENQALARRWFA